MKEFHEYRFDQFRLDTDEETLWRGPERLRMNRRTLGVLSLLVERSGKIVSKQDFFDTVWADTFVEDNSLTVAMASLRKILGDDVHSPKFIENIPRKGYRFIADVSIGNLNGKESIGTNGHAATGLPYLDEQLLQTRSNRSPLSLFVSQNPRILFWSLSILLGLILVPFVLGAVSYFFNPNPTIGEKLEVVQLFTPETKLEGDVMSVSFSPDGKYVLFEVLDDGINKIFDRLATGSEMVQITDGRSKEHSPVWSPDGMRIAFISDRDNTVGIRIVSYLGGESSLQIPMSPEPLSYRLVKWSKDGKSIFFETTDGKLNTVELDSRRINEIALTTPDKKSEFRVSPDESRVVYKVTENGSQQLWLQSLGRSEATKLTNNKYRNSSPCWFPDNARIAFHSNRTGTFQIYVTDLSGKKVERITFSNFSSYNPVVSPDGLKIYTKLAQNYDNN